MTIPMTAAAPQFSVEFFPPRNEPGRARLDQVHEDLAAREPDFFSVTYGAGGSTRDGTRSIVLDFHEAGSTVAPHLSSTGLDLDIAGDLLNIYRGAGIRRLVVLRGDTPSGTAPAPAGFYARDLVKFVRRESGDHFHIDVACYPEIHPETPGYAKEIEYFRQKIEAGANSAITQYFFNADSYFRFVDACLGQGVDIPIVPGIMPITNFNKLSAFSAKCGTEIPLWLARRLADFGEDQDGLRKFGDEVVSDLCDRLLRGGAPGLHFYSLNLAGPVGRIWDKLDLSSRR